MNITLKTVFASIKVNSPFILLLILIPSISVGAIYKWVDAEGKTHYGNKPPETSQVQKLNIKVTEPVIPNKIKEEVKTDAKEDNKNKLGQAVPEDQKYSSKERFQICNQAKIDLQRTEAKSRVRENDKEGNVRYLSERELSLRIASAKKDVKEFCR